MIIAAFIVSLVALGASVTSVVYTARSYRRAGARVKVVGSVGRAMLLRNRNGDPVATDVLVIETRNTGLASAQVTNVFFVIERGTAEVVVHPQGPRLPHAVPGQHSESWVVPLTSVREQAGSATHIEVGVTLGDGSQKRAKTQLQAVSK